jgi:hypothetical protein
VNSTDERIPMSKKTLAFHPELQTALVQALAKGVLPLFPLGGNHCCEAQHRASRACPEDKGMKRMQVTVMLPMPIIEADQVCDL